MATPPGAQSTKSFVMQKWGPLPAWAWMLIGLALAVVYSSWKKNKQAASQQQDQGVDLIGGDQNPPVVFQDYDTIITSVNTPPGGGREHPPVRPPLHGAPIPGPSNPPGGREHLPIPNPEPAPAPRPTPLPAPPPPAPKPTPPAPPAGQWVTVAKWTASNPPWNSTLWGISQHVYGNGNLWTSIWNAGQNASLKTRRKDPKLIQPGDQIFVPAR